MMRCIIHRHRDVHICSMLYFTKGQAVGGKSPIEYSKDHQDLGGSSHKQFMSVSSYLGSISTQRQGTHNNTLGWHYYPDGHAHVIYLWQHRDLCTMAPQEPVNLEQEVGREDASKTAWEALASQMQALKCGLARGKSLKALKELVDQLEPFAEPTDLRLGLACLRVAESLIVVGQDPTTIIGYAQRALQSLETLSQSLEHASSLFILGLAYFQLREFRKAALHLEQCLLVLRQMKTTWKRSILGMKCERSIFAFNAHYLLGKIGSHLRNFSESIGHYEHAIRICQQLPTAKRSMPKLHYETGLVFRHLVHFDVAMGHAQKALEGYMTHYGPSSLQVGKVRALMAGLHCDLWEYDDALYNYNEAKPILEYLGQTEEFTTMNCDLAILLIHQRKYNAALPFLEEVIKSTKVASGLHFATLISATVVASALNLEVAADYCKKAFDASDHQETSRDTAIGMAYLAMLCVEREEFVQAAVLFHKAIEMLEKFSVEVPHSVYAEDKAVQKELGRTLGLLPLSARKIKEAITFFDSLLKMEGTGNFEEILIARYRLGTAYLKGKQEVEAMKHFEACSRMRDVWFHMKLMHAYEFAIKNRDIDNMGVLENVCRCVIWLFI